MIKRMLLGAAVLLGATQVWAAEVTVTAVSVRATAPGQDSAAVSLRLTAKKDARLVAASSPAAERVEIHIMKRENGMMAMREAADLALPANREVVLGAGSHLMLVGLKQPLRAGSQVTLALTVEYADKRRETVSAVAEVRPLVSGRDMHDMQDDMHNDMHDDTHDMHDNHDMHDRPAPGRDY